MAIERAIPSPVKTKISWSFYNKIDPFQWLLFFPGNNLFCCFQGLFGCFVWLNHWIRCLMTLPELGLLWGRAGEGRPTQTGQPCRSVASGRTCQEGQGRRRVSNLGKNGIATQKKCQLGGLWAGCLEGSVKKRADDRKRWTWGGLEKGRNKECVGEEEAGQGLAMRMKWSVRHWGQVRDKEEGLRGW